MHISGGRGLCSTRCIFEVAISSSVRSHPGFSWCGLTSLAFKD